MILYSTLIIQTLLMQKCYGDFFVDIQEPRYTRPYTTKKVWFQHSFSLSQVGSVQDLLGLESDSDTQDGLPVPRVANLHTRNEELEATSAT